MSEVKIIGDAVKNMPWQEGPAEFSGAPVWRSGFLRFLPFHR